MPQDMTIVRTDPRNPDFIALVRQLDADLAERDGAEHPFYAAFNTIDTLKHVVLAYDDNAAMGCGALKEHSSTTIEIKRMFVVPAGRRRGIASRVLAALEAWAEEMSYTKCILETGKKQPEAIALYRKNGYRETPNYGQYVGVENSLCFEKEIAASNSIL